MKIFTLLGVAILAIAFSTNVFSESDGHSDHDDLAHKKQAKKGHDDHKAHKEQAEHNDSDDHKSESDHKDDHKEDDHKDGEKDDHAGHDEHGSSNFGKGRAIAAIKNDGNIFKLSEESLKVLEIISTKLKNSKSSYFSIPASSIVEYQENTAVFRQNKDWFEIVNVSVISKDSNKVKIKSSKLKDGDNLVSSGTALLRIAHLQATGQGGKGHAH